MITLILKMTDERMSESELLRSARTFVNKPIKSSEVGNIIGKIFDAEYIGNREIELTCGFKDFGFTFQADEILNETDPYKRIKFLNLYLKKAKSDNTPKRVFVGYATRDPTINAQYNSFYIEDDDGMAVGTMDMLEAFVGKKVVIIIGLAKEENKNDD